MNRKRIEKKPKRNLCIDIIAFAVALAFIMPGAIVFANDEGTFADNTIVSIDPSTQKAEKGDPFTVDVYVVPGDVTGDPEGITGVQCDLYFDQTLIQADLVEEGDLFSGHAVLFDAGTIDNGAGTIMGVYGVVIDELPLPIDPAVFVTISFTAMAKSGTSPLDLDEVIVIDYDGDPVTIAVDDGSVTAGEVSPIEWDATLNFEEDSGKLDYVVFGEALGANDGDPPDSYDAPKPPEPMQPYLCAWFDDNLPEKPYNKLWEDYRRYPDTYKAWDLYAQWMDLDSTPTNVTISWDTGGFTGCEYNSVVLWRYDPFDMEWDFAADMLVSNSYVYTPRWFNEQWLTDQFQIRAYINNPYVPSNPNPNNGATGVDINADLGWTGGDPDDGDIVTYDVYFDTDTSPGLEVEGQSSTSFNPLLQTDTTYHWKIVAWDNHGASTPSSTWSFTTETASSNGNSGNNGNNGNSGNGDGTTNLPPVADASAGEPYQGFINSEILFNGTLSYDPDDDGYIASWHWDFGDETKGTGEIITHIYSNLGTYTVTLTVTDNEDAKDTNETTAIIGQPTNPPTAPIVDGVTSGDKDTEYTYTAVSTDPDNDTIRYLFDWDDDTNNTVSDFLASGILFNTSHNWTTSGVYTITVYAKDENNALSGTTEMTVFIDMNVRFIDDVIQGYLLDVDNDGIYDIFHNNATGDETTVELQDNGNYLLDSDGDALWNYEYDPVTCMIASYPGEEEPTDEKEETPWYLLIVVAILVIIFIVVYGAKKLKEQQELKKQVRRELKEEAERKAKKEKAEQEEKEAKEQEAKSKEEEAEKKDKEEGSAEEKSEGDKP